MYWGKLNEERVIGVWQMFWGRQEAWAARAPASPNAACAPQEISQWLADPAVGWSQTLDGHRTPLCAPSAGEAPAQASPFLVIKVKWPQGPSPPKPNPHKPQNSSSASRGVRADIDLTRCSMSCSCTQQWKPCSPSFLAFSAASFHTASSKLS